MIEILLLAGTCGDGPGSYRAGLFHMPDGILRGVEDLRDLTVSSVPETAPRRHGIARGLRDALTATGPLPRPLGLAASVVGLGLDVLGGGQPSGLQLDLHFTDGAVSSVRTDADGAARIEGDREVVRLALLRQAAARFVDATVHPSADMSPDGSRPKGPDDRDLVSIFTYEKRGGRLRRLAAKALEAPEPAKAPEAPEPTKTSDATRALDEPGR